MNEPIPDELAVTLSDGVPVGRPGSESGVRRVVPLAFALLCAQAGFYAFAGPLPIALSLSGVSAEQIGVVVGLAPIVQIPAALLCGPLIDRFGGTRVFYLSCLCYLAAALGFASDQGGGATVLILRAIQGIGLGLALPSALSLVPALVLETRARALGLAVVASSNPLGLAILTPFSLALFHATSIRGVGVFVSVLVALGAIVARVSLSRAGALRPFRSRGSLRPTFRRGWLYPLLAMALSNLSWGVLVAYLPIRSYAAGLDVSVFFVSDAIAVVTLRLAGGWLADRVGPGKVFMSGLLATGIGMAVLVIEPQLSTLIVGGLFIGSGAALSVTSVLIAIQRRSSERDYGSGFALYSVALAAGLGTGSIAAGPIAGAAGFAAAIAFAGLGLLAAAVLILVDPAAGAHEADGIAPASP